MGKVRQVARKYGWKTTIIAILGAAYPYFTTIVNNAHSEAIRRIEIDSARQSVYQVWNNNLQACQQEKLDSIFKFNCNP